MSNLTVEQFKKAMSQFASGVCVVTYTHPQTKSLDGVTISAFSSLSLSPQKILFCLGNQGKTAELFKDIDRFTINILNKSQVDLAYQFAGDNRENLSEVTSQILSTPCLKDTLATIVCDKGNTHTEGDHDIIIGEIQHIEFLTEDKLPMLYFRSKMMD